MLQWKLKRVPDGYLATLQVPCDGGGALTVHQRAAGKEAAVMKASALLQAAAENPIAAALLPPGTASAVKYAGQLASAVRAGEGAAAVARAVGPGAKRLAKALKFW